MAQRSHEARRRARFAVLAHTLEQHAPLLLPAGLVLGLTSMVISFIVYGMLRLT